MRKKKKQVEEVDKYYKLILYYLFKFLLPNCLFYDKITYVVIR